VSGHSQYFKAQYFRAQCLRRKKFRCNEFRKKTRLAHSSQPGKVNFAWGVRLKRGAFGGQANVNVGAT
jgi:hypothetical protein